MSNDLTLSYTLLLPKLGQIRLARSLVVRRLLIGGTDNGACFAYTRREPMASYLHSRCVRRVDPISMWEIEGTSFGRLISFDLPL